MNRIQSLDLDLDLVGRLFSFNVKRRRTGEELIINDNNKRKLTSSAHASKGLHRKKLAVPAATASHACIGVVRYDGFGDKPFANCCPTTVAQQYFARNEYDPQTQQHNVVWH